MIPVRYLLEDGSRMRRNGGRNSSFVASISECTEFEKPKRPSMWAKTEKISGFLN